MNNYIIRKILHKNTIDKVNSTLSNLRWHDGVQSTTEISKEQKNNLESESEIIDEIIMSSIDKDSSFFDYTIPKESTKCLISKMNVGGYYHAHEDMFYLGQFSTTVFLTNKDDYDGGELCLLINGEEVKIKLDYSYSITYPTGILHRVNRVTNGERIVAVFWTKTLITDDFTRELYSNAVKIRDILKKSYFNGNFDNLNSCKDNPYILCNTICNAILRKNINY